MAYNRNSDYDVTGTVQVSSPDAVCEAVQDIYQRAYPGKSFTALETAFSDFRRLFSGELPGYRGCDTVYHDMQHTLDVTLAMSRLLGGYDRVAEPGTAMGPRLAAIGIVTALFHDAGYILSDDDVGYTNGAEVTKIHVSRSAAFMKSYLPTIGMADAVPIACRIVHFTGYEVALDKIPLTNPRYRTLGTLLGTADLIAQMADRCYLEKCRDRLYMEFVLGGIAVHRDQNGMKVHYESGLDLLKKTPDFHKNVFEVRLDGVFNGAYRYFEPWFGGDNPYIESINANLGFLETLMNGGDWEQLRRAPPVFTSSPSHMDDTQSMVVAELRKLFADH